METLKAEVVKTGHYRVLAIPFGGPLKGKDFDRQYFSERTDTKPDWFNERPVIWHHGLDKTYDEDLKIGYEGPITKSKEGWWAELWLNKQNRYFEEMDSLIAREKMYGSSGTMPHLIKSAADGELLQWPHIEQTLSPVPRNTYSVVRATKALEDFAAAGIKSETLNVLAQLEDLTTDLRDLTSVQPGDDTAARELRSTLSELESIVARIGG